MQCKSVHVPFPYMKMANAMIEMAKNFCGANWHGKGQSVRYFIYCKRAKSFERSELFKFSIFTSKVVYVVGRVG
jgi:hypothetical protein